MSNDTGPSPRPAGSEPTGPHGPHAPDIDAHLSAALQALRADDPSVPEGVQQSILTHAHVHARRHADRLAEQQPHRRSPARQANPDQTLGASWARWRSWRAHVGAAPALATVAVIGTVGLWIGLGGQAPTASMADSAPAARHVASTSSAQPAAAAAAVVVAAAPVRRLSEHAKHSAPDVSVAHASASARADSTVHSGTVPMSQGTAALSTAVASAQAAPQASRVREAPSNGEDDAAAVGTRSGSSLGPGLAVASASEGPVTSVSSGSQPTATQAHAQADAGAAISAAGAYATPPSWAWAPAIPPQARADAEPVAGPPNPATPARPSPAALTSAPGTPAAGSPPAGAAMTGAMPADTPPTGGQTHAQSAATAAAAAVTPLRTLASRPLALTDNLTLGVPPLQRIRQVTTSNAIRAALQNLESLTRGQWRIVDAAPPPRLPGTSREQAPSGDTVTLTDGDGVVRIDIVAHKVRLCASRESRCWEAPLMPPSDPSGEADKAWLRRLQAHAP
jgi:hypothetical protein